MPDWQVTAATIFCDICRDEVTLMVYKDGKVKCTGASRRPGTSKKTSNVTCSTDTCSRMAEYKARLDAEEQSARG